MQARRTVVVCWQRFGPYHLARLRGASRVLGKNWRVVGLEVAGMDHYAWQHASGEETERRTLFPTSDYATIGRAEIRARATQMLDELTPEAVCVNGWAVPEAIAAMRWARRAGRRIILMSETFESPFNPVKQTVKRWRVAACHAAIVGGSLQERYLRKLGFHDRSVELGYDVVDNDHFASPARTRPGWSTAIAPRRSFFANTRFLERKGIDALLRAYARYRQLHSRAPGRQPWPLVISGAGEMEQSWKQLAESLGVADLVYWPGFLQYADLPAAYQYAGAFVHPARREPWGLVVNEAAAAGLSLVIGRQVGAACELLRDGENGFLIDPDDVGALAGVLLRMSEASEETRLAMGRRSQQLVAAFGPDRFGEALRNCLS